MATETTTQLRNTYRTGLVASGLTAAAFKAACRTWIFARAADNEDTVEEITPADWAAAAYWTTRAA